MKGDQCCRNCFYWQPLYEDSNLPSESWIPGHCRARPPIYHVSDEWGVQPATSSRHWCGEWRAETPDSVSLLTLGMAKAAVAGDGAAAMALLDRLTELRSEQ